MRTCPLCETTVPGSSCEVCGHVLPAPVDLFAAIPGVAERDAGTGVVAVGPGESPLEIEPTRFAAASAPVAGVPVAPLLEIEPTRFAAAPMPLVGAVPEVDLEASLPTPDVAAGGMPDFDRGREAEEERTPQPSGPAPCRYCRHVQAEGRICDLCGMRLPVRPIAAAPPAAAVPEGLVRCRNCFERTPPGGRCANCGAVLAAAS